MVTRVKVIKDLPIMSSQISETKDYEHNHHHAGQVASGHPHPPQGAEQEGACQHC